MKRPASSETPDIKKPLYDLMKDALFNVYFFNSVATQVSCFFGDPGPFRQAAAEYEKIYDGTITIEQLCSKFGFAKQKTMLEYLRSEFDKLSNNDPKLPFHILKDVISYTCKILVDEKHPVSAQVKDGSNEH